MAGIGCHEADGAVLVFEIEIHKVKSSPGSGKTVGKAQDEARAAFQKALAVPEGEL